MHASLLAFLLSASVLQSGEADRATEARYAVGEIELAGELLFPNANGPFAAVVISQGSGSSARDNLWARAAAEMLRDEGLLVLLTDKRGSGASQGDWRDIGIAERADDLLAGVEHLQRRSDVDAQCVGVFGLSQGGRVVPVAAARSDEVAFLVNASGDLVSFPEQILHEMRNDARGAGLSEEAVGKVLEIGAAALRALGTGDWSDYHRLKREAEDKEWGEFVGGFPDESLPDWAFYRENLEFDAMPFWVRVDQPALILLGIEDEQQNVAVQESIRRLEFMQEVSGKTNIRAAQFDDLGHLLGWTNDAPYDPRVRAELSNFLGTVPCIAAKRGEKG
ncbi:alpha/beta hydrolase family protein [Sphingomicrobium nitratireducens]|uniref:alpha/beta hydrolase family protein n=1 Tax=Sphingomicrobium nitratireducens TaxID=2964666 RepID=UPI00224072A4|nr:prolyl oligopeptidase family serine peptidase [Sphingomicrobium nitratireducens]